MGQQDSTQQSASKINNWRELNFVIQSDTLWLDSLPVFPNSVLIRGNSGAISDSTYAIDDNLLIFQKRPIDSTVQIRFRVFPYPVTKKKQHKDEAVIGKVMQHDGLIGSGYTYNPFTQGGDAFNFSGLNYSGTFARGISLGNSQDLVLNSEFNLKVAGKLGDIEILGAISDNNVPLQPEGNTQQLDEFDQIYVQFKYKRQKLIAGDYNIQRPKGSYFMNYYRRLQGGQVFTDLKIGKKGRLKTDGSFAVSKGKFARNQFDGIEGNQGPYRLQGANGEQFIIVIAGTERVYMDGKLLTRGADNDYTIDYNLGEITFTPKQLITKDKRLQVEFSYTDLAFVRTLGTANMVYETKKTNVRFNFYSEQDAKGQTVTESLSDSARAVLQRVGDDINSAYVSGITIPDRDANNVGVIFYKKIDTTVYGQLHPEILVFSNNQDSAIYTAKFSIVSGGGNYIRVQGAANGVVYQWVAPDSITGAPQGTHEPIRLLVTPKQRQLFNFGADQKIGENGVVSMDLALSNVDQNTFSDIGNEDNQGFAGRLTYKHKIPLFIGKIPQSDTARNDSLAQGPKTTLNIQAHYEYLMKEFEFIEPYRPREFARDWNINLPEKTQEHLYKARISLEGDRWGNVAYEFSGLNKESLYNGYRHSLAVNTRYKGLFIKSNSSLVQTTTQAERGLFVRPRLDVSYTFKKLKGWKIGAYGELEQNQRVNLESDTLVAGSFYYNLFKVYSELPLVKGLNLRAHYSRRHDYTPREQNFLVNSVADDANFGGEWRPSKVSSLKWDLSYRNLRIQDTLLTTQESKETYLGRLEYTLRIGGGVIYSKTIYQLGSGQQQQVQYSYVKVDQGQGQYIWVDRNGDEAEQLNEFELAQFADQANYIRLTLLTGEFVRTNNVVFSQNLTIRPAKWIANIKRKKGRDYKIPLGLEILRKFSTRSQFKIDRKTYDGAEGVLAFNPFQLDVADTSLVTISTGIQNTLFFVYSEAYRLEFAQRTNQGKNLLNTGFETRNLSEYALTQRLNFKPKFKPGKKMSPFVRELRMQLALLGALGFQGNVSELFAERNYDIEYYKLNPEFTFNYKRQWRLSFKYNFQYKENRIGKRELARSHDVTFEFGYRKPPKTSVDASFSIVQLEYNGDPTSAVGYTMTEGLQSGSNYLWNVSFSQELSKNIRMILTYEGRKTGDNSPIVHVGRAQIRATF